jgi:hypothetical protein
MNSNWIIVATFLISKRDALYTWGICELSPGCTVWHVAVLPLSGSPFPSCVQVVARVYTHWEMSVKIETLGHALHLMFLRHQHGQINSVLVVFPSYRHLMLKLRLRGAVPPVTYMPWWCAQAQLYQYFITVRLDINRLLLKGHRGHPRCKVLSVSKIWGSHKNC